MFFCELKLLKISFYSLCGVFYFHEYMYIACMLSALRGQRGNRIPWKWMIMGCHGVLETDPMSSA